MHKTKIPSDAVTSLGKGKTSYKSIIASAFRKINAYFLGDEDTEEYGTVGDHLVFYGAIGFNVIVSIYIIYRLLTF